MTDIQAEIDQMILDDLLKDMEEELGDLLEEEVAKRTIKTKANISEGEICIKCKEFFPFAEPNQSDGTLKCYACRKFG